MVNIKLASLLDLVPESIRCDPQVLAAAKALDNELKAVTAAIPETLLLSRIDDLPEPVIDHLAWQWHVDCYEPVGLDLAKKRKLVKSSIAQHRRKGTPYGVEFAMSIMLADAWVQEWFEYGGEPYFFQVESTDLLTSTAEYDRLFTIIFDAKNTRSWLELLRIYRDRIMNMYFGIVQQTNKAVTIYPEVVEQVETPHNVYVGQVQVISKVITIYPEAI